MRLGRLNSSSFILPRAKRFDNVDAKRFFDSPVIYICAADLENRLAGRELWVYRSSVEWFGSAVCHRKEWRRVEVRYKRPTVARFCLWGEPRNSIHLLLLFLFRHHRIPIYGDCISFAHIGGNSHDELLVDTVSMYPQGIAALMASSAGFRLFSVGLFMHSCIQHVMVHSGAIFCCCKWCDALVEVRIIPVLCLVVVVSTWAR